LEFSVDRQHIVQGGGLSLSAASFDDGSLVTGMRRFNRILSFDPINLTVHAEAGITLGELYAFLMAKGLCVPVQPGFPGVTLGGCIAGNVHGKNQYREGSFLDIVREINLYHPSRGMLRLTTESSPELFDLTCGGLGLTGLIVSAVISLKSVPLNSVRVTYSPVGCLAETVEKMTEMRDDHELLYSWHDLANKGPRMGQGLIISGQYTEDCHPRNTLRHRRETLDSGRWLPPYNALNGLSLRLANRAYQFINGSLKKEALIGVYDMFFPFASWQAYIDAYGSKGFIEHQVLIPSEQIFAYLSEFGKLHKKFDVSIGLATIKMFDGEQRFLRFVGKGISFAIHIAANAKALAFLDELDRLDINHQSIANIIKDSRVPGSVIREQYKEFDLMRTMITQHDPDRLFSSALSRRIGL
jgi:decaprenylphospho-beta-D-ribofuranose 2-oxidase